MNCCSRTRCRVTEADRESLHAFFLTGSRTPRADDTATSWEQQLGEVFDYTAWHRFMVKVDRAERRRAGSR